MSSTLPCEWSLEAFQPRQSLWKLVEEFVPESEQREIKEVLGQDIVDETNDLHKEVDMLLEIWQDYRDDNDKKAKELSLNSKFHRLPEPPQVRDNLKKEIQLFVSALKQRSAENNTSNDIPLSRREEGIVEYAFHGADFSRRTTDPTRPLTARSSESGRMTPFRSTSSSGSESRSSSSIGDVIESFYDQLNIQDFEHLAEKLRNILLEEKESLTDDVAFLQNCLFEESQPMQYAPEPSLQELKELGIKLEKEMTKKRPPTSPSIRKPSRSSPPRRPTRNQKLFRSSSSPAVGTEVGTSLTRGVDRSPVQPSPSQSEQESLSPSPPSSAVPRRPGSAARFRRLVLDSRLGES